MTPADGPSSVRKLEPMAHGRTDLRKRKPRQVAVIAEHCTGCAGSPVCVIYCPVEACMFWVPDAQYEPFGRIEVDKSTCIGCAKCASRGPGGTLLDGCPWDAVYMVNTASWEADRGTVLPDVVTRPVSEWEVVPSEYV